MASGPPPLRAQRQMSGCQGSISLRCPACLQLMKCSPGHCQPSVAPLCLPLALRPPGQAIYCPCCMASSVPPCPKQGDGADIHVLKPRHLLTESSVSSNKYSAVMVYLGPVMLQGLLLFGIEGWVSSITILSVEEMLRLGSEKRKGWKCSPFPGGGHIS